jgi:hypothetical protein
MTVWGDEEVPAFRCLGGSSSCDYPAKPPGMRQPVVKQGSGEGRSLQEKSAKSWGSCLFKDAPTYSALATS